MRILLVHNITDIIQGTAGNTVNCHVKPCSRIIIRRNTVPIRILFHYAKGGKSSRIEHHALEAPGPAFRSQPDVFRICAVFPKTHGGKVYLYTRHKRGVFDLGTTVIPYSLHTIDRFKQILSGNDHISFRHPEADGIVCALIINSDICRFSFARIIGYYCDGFQLILIVGLSRHRYLFSFGCPLLITADLTEDAFLQTDAVSRDKCGADHHGKISHRDHGFIVLIDMKIRTVRNPWPVFPFTRLAVQPLEHITLRRLDGNDDLISAGSPVDFFSVLRERNLSLRTVTIGEQLVLNAYCGNEYRHITRGIQPECISAVIALYTSSVHFTVHSPAYIVDLISLLQYRLDPDRVAHFRIAGLPAIDFNYDILQTFRFLDTDVIGIRCEHSLHLHVTGRHIECIYVLLNYSGALPGDLIAIFAGYGQALQLVICLRPHNQDHGLSCICLVCSGFRADRSVRYRLADLNLIISTVRIAHRSKAGFALPDLYQIRVFVHPANKGIPFLDRDFRRHDRGTVDIFYRCDLASAVRIKGQFMAVRCPRGLDSQVLCRHRLRQLRYPARKRIMIFCRF